ncbi:MAG: hypothetical protein ACK5Q7_08140 [Cyanobacteriota bacterium]
MKDSTRKIKFLSWRFLGDSIGTGLGFFMLLIAAFLVIEGVKFFPQILLILGVIVFVGATITTLLQYLAQDQPTSRERLDAKTDNAALIGTHILLEERIASLENKEIGISEQARDDIVSSLVRNASTRLGDMVDSELESRYGSARDTLRKISFLESNVEESTERLRQEIRALLRRGNLNLVLGTLATVIAISVLVYTAILTVGKQGNTSDILQGYLIRVSLVLFIQIFGFFFLRLYRVSLSDIKYFQNEITNMQQQWLSLKYALLCEDRDTAKNIATILASTERNFILRKGETTIDLERLKFDQNDHKELLSSLKSLLHEKRWRQ